MPPTDDRLRMLKDNFNREEVRRIRTNPARFRDILNIVRADDETLPFRPDPWQRRDLEHMDPAFMRMAGFDAQPQHRLAWLERPRGHSKTTDMACMVAYALYASPRTLNCYAAAGDREQAALLRDGVDKLVRANPFLSSYLEVQEHKVVNVCTGSTMQIMSAHVGSSYGINPDLVLVDEITVWDEGRGELLWESLHTAIGKKKNSVLVVITNAGTKRSWQFPIREAIRDNKEWYFSHLPGTQASWLSKEFIESQRAICRSQARFDRLWQNEWIASDESDALSYADIQAALRAVGEVRGPARERENGWVYLAGLDLGISRDATALATIAVDVGWIEEVPRQGKEQERGSGSGRRSESNAMRIMREQAWADGDFYDEEPGAGGTNGEGDAAALPPQDYVTRGGTGRVKLVDVEVWQPTGKGDRVQLEGVKQAILKLDERFGLSGIAADNYQAEMLVQELRGRGLPITGVHVTGTILQECATTLLDLFREQRIDLFDYPPLIADLQALRLVHKSYGFRLESPRRAARMSADDRESAGTRHGDCAFALQLAAWLSRDQRYRMPVGQMKAWNERELLCWP